MTEVLSIIWAAPREVSAYEKRLIATAARAADTQILRVSMAALARELAPSTFHGPVVVVVGSSKDAAYFDIGFEAEQVRWAKGGGEDIRGKIGPKQKQWLCSNFKVEIGGLPCQRIATVDSFTWKCAVAADMLGVFCENTKHPAKVTVPDLKLSISYADQPLSGQSGKASPSNTIMVVPRGVVNPHETISGSITSPGCSGHGCQDVRAITRCTSARTTSGPASSPSGPAITVQSGISARSAIARSSWSSGLSCVFIRPRRPS